MNGKRSKSVIAAAASVILVAGAFFARKNAQPVTADVFFLDTYCTMTVYKGGDKDVLPAAKEELKRYDALFNAESESSDIYRINHRSSDTVPISEETAEMLSMAYEVQKCSGGALWMGIRPLTELWDIKNRKSRPSDDEIRKALRLSEEATFEIEGPGPEGWVFRAGNEGTMIEAGAFAKGYIADRLKELFIEKGVRSAIIDLGGNVHTVGENTDGTPFRIGIKDPEGAGSYQYILEVTDESVVTAGSYERYFEENGIRYHHILDPKTGCPADTGLSSVTVKGPSSFVCDALATACFVLGEEEGRALMEKYNSENGTGYEGIFIKE